jgi:hypothetical protein
MNEIYWQQKRMMTSKQFSPSRPIQSRRLYDNIYQPIDNRCKTYSNVTNRSYHNISLPYASGAYGVYRRVPANLKGPPSSYGNISRRLDLRNKSYYSQQCQLSPGVNNNYDYGQYDEINGLINAIYGDEMENDDDDIKEYCSDIFNYTFPIKGVSLKSSIIFTIQYTFSMAY